MSGTLYELSEAYMTLLDMYDTADDDAHRDEILAIITATAGAIEDKAEAYARIMRNYKAEADGYKAEIDRLNARYKAANHAVERLQGALLAAMQLLDLHEIQTSIGKWRTQNNPPRAEILDEAAVPEEWRIPQPDKIDRAGIMKHYRETGEIIPGTEIRRDVGIRFR